MKLNLLLFFIFGVSASASGIRGFAPTKGSERMLKPSSSDSDSKSKSTSTSSAKGASSSDSDSKSKSISTEGSSSSDSDSKSKSKSISTEGSSSSDSDSKSKSKSSSTEGSSSSDSDSKSKSKSTSSGDGASKTIRIVVNSDDEVVGCSGSGSKCNRFYSECTTNEATTKTLLDVDDRVRRLSSKSSSSGEDHLDSVYRLTYEAIDECDLGEVKHYVEAADDSKSTSTSSSTSSDTSNKSRRAR